MKILEFWILTGGVSNRGSGSFFTLYCNRHSLDFAAGLRKYSSRVLFDFLQTQVVLSFRQIIHA